MLRSPKDEGTWLCEGPLDEGKWLCEGPLDEGNFVARANCFANVFDLKFFLKK
jgi:hypothetical protein